MGEEPTLICGCHDAVEGYSTAAAHTTGATLFCVEMVLSWRSGNDLAVLGDPKALGIRFIVLHSL